MIGHNQLKKDGSNKVMERIIAICCGSYQDALAAYRGGAKRIILRCFFAFLLLMMYSRRGKVKELLCVSLLTDYPQELCWATGWQSFIMK